VSDPVKVMLVAVEASADALGAGLATALRQRLGPEGVTFVGVGGAKMTAQGLASPFDIAELSLVGLFEIAGSVPRALRLARETVRLAQREAPDVAVLIDSWFFMWLIGGWMRWRAPGLPLIKYVAPQVWATRPGRARSAARIFDHMMTLFAFEPRYFEAEGLPTTFVGNPTLNRDVSAADPDRWRRSIGVAGDQPILLVLPGSRRSELKRILPAFEDAAMRLKDRWPGLEVAVLAAETVSSEVKARVAGWRHRAHVVEGEADKLDAMRAGTVALTKSGTATTELALAGCPMVVGYRAHPATALVARALMKVPFLTLFNIAAGEAVAPELLQERCNGAELAASAAMLLEDPERRRAQAAAQTAALAKLGANLPDPFGAAADVVVKVLAEWEQAVTR
jgi:lipid-A-disaccharide synthase